MRSVATALKVVEEVQAEVQEIKDEWENEDVERNGRLNVEEIRSSCDDHEMTRTNETWATMWCAIMTTTTWLLIYAHMGSRLHSRVDVHVRCVGGALGLGGHVVNGVVRLLARFYHAYSIPNVQFFPSGFCSPLMHL